MVVERKYERDIDLLLAEEFSISPEFANWFLSHTKFSSASAIVHDVYVSKTNNIGESDLVIVFEETGGGGRFALLIEDKIDAPLQPNQLERYEFRGQEERDSGDYGDFQVVLCSPDAYRSAHDDLKSFEPFVSYEKISDFFRQELKGRRGAYRADFVATAAAALKGGVWSRIDDEATNQFWDSAYIIAKNEFPILEMRPLKVTKDSTWINFRPQDMPTDPTRIYVSFKGDRGFMDLTFTGCDYERFSRSVASLLHSDMTVHRTGKSCAIRIAVEGFKISKPSDVGEMKVRNAFAACGQLIRFYRDHKHALDRAASESRLSLWQR